MVLTFIKTIQNGFQYQNRQKVNPFQYEYHFTTVCIRIKQIITAIFQLHTIPFVLFHQNTFYKTTLEALGHGHGRRRIENL